MATKKGTRSKNEPEPVPVGFDESAGKPEAKPIEASEADLKEAAKYAHKDPEGAPKDLPGVKAPRRTDGKIKVDVYLKTMNKVKIHHIGGMKAFAEKRGKIVATPEEFAELFKTY